MLFTKRFWPGLADGSITVAFRRWRRSRVGAGRAYRTPAGRLQVDDVVEVDPASITDADAARAGHATAAALLADLRGEETLPVYRIEFHLLDEPDPREVLAATAELDEAAVAAINRRLDRLDRTNPRGPWTRPTLRAIADHPAVRAPDLAATFGRPTQAFKTDVRKLKNLGLTRSLRVGYELSPRGKAYLTSLERPPTSS